MIHTLLTDQNPAETQEWLDSLAGLLEVEGPERTQFILRELLNFASQHNSGVAGSGITAYVNSIRKEDEAQCPGNAEMEERISSLIRWNALAMVLNGGKIAPELGGHIATYASAALLYEVGFNHFFHAPTETQGGDLLYIQGHASPGIYARSFLEGRLSPEQLGRFRQEIDETAAEAEVQGLSSYPHPWLMPDYWQFPTVSMGLGPLQAIYQARFMKYLMARGLVDCTARKVWCFCGDGEMDEPESLGALTIASREKLDNLIFVINCNLQRLDGPVRGNSNIVQELEGIFRGAGWNVLKVLWGDRWDPLFAKDESGLLVKRMSEVVDGEYQNYKALGGAYTRENFFGKYPELLELVADMSDEDIANLNRGGHDPQKVYAAYHKAVHHEGQPTVILVKSVKGYGMGAAGEAQNITHQQKKMDNDAVKAFRDRFNIPITDEQIANCPFYRPPEDSPEIKYLKERRAALNGYLPQRKVSEEVLTIPPLSAFAPLMEATGERHISTTMAFVRILNILLKDKNLNSRIVPIIPDEARTFGMEGLFRQIGIYSPVGQLYQPMDRAQVMYYREDKQGQILEEGINEAGAMASWIAAGTSYAIHQYPMIPFYIYYSMFGFQRVGDLAWAAGDAQTRGFLLGATAGRTTLAGEGLQHQDGHSLILASTIPNCIAYDPAFAYELAVIMQDGLRRMYQEKENVFYYITLMNENYEHPAMPAHAEEGIIKGMYLFQKGTATKAKHTVQLLGSGTILREVIFAAEMLKDEFDINADVWSVTSFNELRRDGIAVERWNRFHPTATPEQPYVTQCLTGTKGPIIAATDYMRAYADQIRPYISQRFITLGTDGYGRSDTRRRLRHFFEVDKRYIVIAALKALADQNQLPMQVVADAIKKYNIDPEKPNPVDV